MYIYVALAALLILSLTPLVLSQVSAEVKLLTLYATGAGALHAIFYCGFLPVIKDTHAADRINYNWFMLYIVLAVAIPMLTSLPFIGNDAHTVVVIMLTTGLLFNNVYLQTEKLMYRILSSMFYTLGTSYVLMKLLGMDSVVKDIGGIVIILTAMTCLNVIAVEWLFKRIRCGR